MTKKDREKHIKSFMKPPEDWKTGKITVYHWSAFTLNVLPSLFTPQPSPRQWIHVTTNGHQVLPFFAAFLGHTLDTENPFLKP